MKTKEQLSPLLHHDGRHWSVPPSAQFDKLLAENKLTPMHNDPHNENDGWQTATTLLICWGFIRPIIIIFGILWLIGKGWGCIADNPVIGG